MIVDDLDVPSFAIAPHKTDPPLIVNANAALTLAVAAQRLQAIAGRNTQIVKLLRRVNCKKFNAGATLNLRRQIANSVPCEDRSRAFVTKALDHNDMP
jgi:hypothetical protein